MEKDEYLEHKSHLDDLEIAELKRQIQAYETTVHNLNLQLTEKDIVIDRYISKIHQIRGLVEKI